MIVTYLRSSSIGAFELCQFKYFLNYMLGIREPGNQSANIGNAIHKALELFAREKQAKQNNEPSFIEPESKKEFEVGTLTPESVMNFGWNMYLGELGQREKHRDGRSCMTYLNQVLASRIYDPRNMDIVQPEQYFDIELPYDWATFDYKDPHTGDPIQGRLAVKGTMDLITRETHGTIGYTDWKTGRKWNWAKDKEKTFEDLMNDDQLLLYYYALRHSYPTEHIGMTIYYVKEDGPTSLPYGDEQLEASIKMLKQKSQAIRETLMPSRRMDTCGPRGKPCSFCHYNKSKMDNGSSVCDYFWKELQQLGMDRVTKKHGSPGAFGQYGSGGGASNRDA